MMSHFFDKSKSRLSADDVQNRLIDLFSSQNAPDEVQVIEVCVFSLLFECLDIVYDVPLNIVTYLLFLMYLTSYQKESLANIMK